MECPFKFCQDTEPSPVFCNSHRRTVPLCLHPAQLVVTSTAYFPFLPRIVKISTSVPSLMQVYLTRLNPTSFFPLYLNPIETNAFLQPSIWLTVTLPYPFVEKDRGRFYVLGLSRIFFNYPLSFTAQSDYLTNRNTLFVKFLNIFFFLRIFKVLELRNRVTF